MGWKQTKHLLMLNDEDRIKKSLLHVIHDECFNLQRILYFYYSSNIVLIIYRHDCPTIIKALLFY